jgi:bifunctional non-homologous end joining protein LigD
MFVVHQHDATRMHWDLRLEIDGVLCSWAVPKAPSMDPDDKRLAVKVENHPLEYVHFEAVIPEGNYGAGPMIAWDRGMFRPLSDPAQGLRDGEIKFELYGYKLRGAFTLVHTANKGRRRSSNDWLLIKKRDGHATSEPAAATSVLSGLTVDELAAHAPRHQELVAELAARGLPRRALDLPTLAPMLCETADAPFSSPEWVFELKYDGFRLLAQGGAALARLRYRSGLDSTDRYPELTSALRALPVADIVLDGEIVVFDAEGRPDFQALAERAQLHRSSEIQRAALARPVTYVVFDALAAGGFDLRALPLVERKALLRRIVPALGPLRFGDHVEQRGEELLAQVVARGLEGVVAKRASSPYRGKRSNDWLKLKLDPEADFAICGYTTPKGTRTGLGALHLCVRRAARGPTLARSAAALTTSSSPSSRRSWPPRRAGSRRSPNPRARATPAGSSPISRAACATASGPRAPRCAFRCSSACAATSPRSSARCHAAAPASPSRRHHSKLRSRSAICD